jgi:hypothetical protein
MSGTFAIIEDDSGVGPGNQVTFDLGEVIEGPISVVLSAVEDPFLQDQTLVPSELQLELLRNGGSVFLTSGQLTALVVGPRVAHAADVGPLLTRQQPRLSIPPLMLPPLPEPIRRATRPRQLPFPSQDSEEFNNLLFLARGVTGRPRGDDG